MLQLEDLSDATKNLLREGRIKQCHFLIDRFFILVSKV